MSTAFVPQANELLAVRTVLTAVSINLGDPKTIARALERSERQAAYYIEAAVGLGLIEREKRGEPYRRTELGRRVNWLGARSALRRIAELALAVPVVQAYTSGGEAAAREYIEAAGYSGETVTRRLSSVLAWHERATDLVA